MFNKNVPNMPPWFNQNLIIKENKQRLIAKENKRINKNFVLIPMVFLNPMIRKKNGIIYDIFPKNV